jgi:sugar (glycoside-pentoside-hexuronide) transporter
MEERKLLTYTKGERNAYLASMVGQNMIYNIIGTAMSYYFQFVIFIPAMIVGVIMTAARVWDAVNDFFMGTLVDKTRSKWGKCRPYLIYAPIPIMIITILCFTNFGFYTEGQTALNVGIVFWAAFTYIVWTMAYTVGDIPLWGVTALMTESSDDRNKLLSLARIAGGIGGGVVLLSIIPLCNQVAPMLSKALSLDSRNGERWAYLIVAAGFAIVATALFQICGFKIKERVVSAEKKPTLKENFKLMLGNKPFKQILLSGILGSPKMLIMLAAMPLIQYYFAAKDSVLSLVYMIVLGGGVFVGQFAGMAVAPYLTKKISKKKIYNYGHLASIIPFVLIFVIYLAAPRTLATNYGLLALLTILFLLNGFCNGVIMVMQSAMIADCIDYEEHKSGTRPDGVFFAGQTFLAKLTSGIATIIASAAYSVVGFSDDAIAKLNDYIANMGPADPLPREMAQYDKFMMILFFIVSIPPAIGCLLSVIPTWKYALDDDRHKEILLELNERRRAKETEAAQAETEPAAIAEEAKSEA